MDSPHIKGFTYFLVHHQIFHLLLVWFLDLTQPLLQVQGKGQVTSWAMILGCP